MAERKAAEDEFDPRHRIVGAVVLVALAVILLPMFLSSQPPDNSQPVAERPGAETRIVTTPVPPLAEDAPPVSLSPADQAEKNPPARTTTHVVPVAEPAGANPVEESRAAAQKPKNSGDGKTVKTVKTATPKKTSSSTKGWTVQVGLFSHVENVSRLQDRLKQKGYSVILDPPIPAPGKLVRVEVGPYRDATAAKAAQARLRDELSIEGVVRKP